MNNLDFVDWEQAVRDFNWYVKNVYEPAKKGYQVYKDLEKVKDYYKKTWGKVPSTQPTPAPMPSGRDNYGNNLRGRPSNKRKQVTFESVLDLPNTAAFRQYMFQGPTKLIHNSIKIPRALRLMYKTYEYKGCREMDLLSPANGQVAQQYLNILPVKELFTMRALAWEHMQTQLGTSNSMQNWTAVLHKDSHKWQIANVCNQPIIVEVFVFQYRDDDNTTFASWRDWVEYDAGGAIDNDQSISNVTNRMSELSPRFNILRDRRGILQNYKLLDKKRLALGPGQNTTYSFIESGDKIISNAHLDEMTTATYTGDYNVIPNAAPTYGLQFMRGISKVVYFRTWCSLLCEESGTAVTTGNDIGTAKAKILVREEVTRVIGCYPITRSRKGNPASNIVLDNTDVTNNPGGPTQVSSNLTYYYNDFKSITGTAAFIDVEADTSKTAATTT